MRLPIANQYHSFRFEKELLGNGSDSRYHYSLPELLNLFDCCWQAQHFLLWCSAGTFPESIFSLIFIISQLWSWVKYSFQSILEHMLEFTVLSITYIIINYFQFLLVATFCTRLCACRDSIFLRSSALYKENMYHWMRDFFRSQMKP